MIRVLADGIIYGKQVRGGVGRLFEESFKRFGADASYGVDVQLMLPEKIQRLPEDLQPAANLHHIDAPAAPPKWMESVGGHRLTNRVAAGRNRAYQEKLRGLGAQVFHSTYYSAPPIDGLKEVVTVYDFIDEHTFTSMSGNPPSFARDIRKRIEAADAVVAISQATKDDILKFTGAKEERVSIITPAYSEFFAEPGTDDEIAKLKRDYGIDGPYWFFVGRRNPYKNFNALLRAWKLFRDQTGIDSWLVVTGAYGDLERFEIAYLMEHGLETRLVMTRTVDDQRLRSLYRGAAAFIFPSLYEGFGIPILEAFACRTPCILADTRVFREVAQDAALYFEPYSDESFAAQMAKALDSDVRGGLIEKGSERLKAYSWDESARQLAELYARLV